MRVEGGLALVARAAASLGALSCTLAGGSSPLGLDMGSSLIKRAPFKIPFLRGAVLFGGPNKVPQLRELPIYGLGSDIPDGGILL